MNEIVWDQAGERIYETGVDHGVLYPQGVNATYPKGVAWNGLISVTESPTGAEPNPKYADNIKYLNLMSAEEFAGTIEAYTFPDEWLACDGIAEPIPGIKVSQQKRIPFGLSYRTLIGNDTEGQDHGYYIHLVYNALASPSEKNYQSINETPEAITLSWEFTTTPSEIAELAPSAKLTIDSRTVDAAKLKALEDILYGIKAVETPEPTPAVPARLPMPNEVIALVGTVG